MNVSEGILGVTTNTSCSEYHLLHMLTFHNSSHANLEKKLNTLIQEVRTGKREGSGISVESVDTLARNHTETWEEL